MHLECMVSEKQIRKAQEMETKMTEEVKAGGESKIRRRKRRVEEGGIVAPGCEETNCLFIVAA